MPSTYSVSTRLELQAAGENSGTWGDITNNNLRVLDSAVYGVAEIAPIGSSSTLATSETGETQGVVEDANKKILHYTNLSEAHTVTISPNSVQKNYVVYNDTSYNLTFRQGDGSAGTAVVPSGTSAIIYSTGTGVNTTAKVVNLTNSLGISDVKITGGTISGLSSPIPVASGGTGSATVEGAQTALSLLPGTDIQAYSARLTDVSNSVADLNNFLVGDGTNIVSQNAVTARTSLGVEIGTDVQAYDDGLLSIAGLTTAADKMIYTSGNDVYNVTDLTSYARTFLAAADADAAVSALSANVTSDDLQSIDVATRGVAEVDKALVLDWQKSIEGINIISANNFSDNAFDNGTDTNFDFTNGSVQFSSINVSNPTFNFSGQNSGSSTFNMTLIITPQVDTLIDWNDTFQTVLWAGGFAPNTINAGETAIISIMSLRNTADTYWMYYGFIAGDNFY